MLFHVRGIPGWVMFSMIKWAMSNVRMNNPRGLWARCFPAWGWVKHPVHFLELLPSLRVGSIAWIATDRLRPAQSGSLLRLLSKIWTNSTVSFWGFKHPARVRYEARLKWPSEHAERRTLAALRDQRFFILANSTPSSPSHMQ
jgi:hypothetical protein